MAFKYSGLRMQCLRDMQVLAHSGTKKIPFSSAELELGVKMLPRGSAKAAKLLPNQAKIPRWRWL
jgi:hypothetical protein